MFMVCCEVLLECVCDIDVLIVEDDYEFEMFFFKLLLLLFKLFDEDGCVIYVGSFFKFVFPGLCFGYFVGFESFICEVCVLCFFVLCYLSGYMMWIVVYFFGFGYYDVLICCMWNEFVKCCDVM